MPINVTRSFRNAHALIRDQVNRFLPELAAEMSSRQDSSAVSKSHLLGVLKTGSGPIGRLNLFMVPLMGSGQLDETEMAFRRKVEVLQFTEAMFAFETQYDIQAHPHARISACLAI